MAKVVVDAMAMQRHSPESLMKLSNTIKVSTGL